MAFEQTALAVAQDCGFEGAYFFSGTMFCEIANIQADSVVKLQQVFPNTKVSNCGDEIAVDFVA